MRLVSLVAKVGVLTASFMSQWETLEKSRDAHRNRNPFFHRPPNSISTKCRCF